MGRMGEDETEVETRVEGDPLGSVWLFPATLGEREEPLDGRDGNCPLIPATLETGNGICGREKKII